jgi:hypothetical protein
MFTTNPESMKHHFGIKWFALGPEGYGSGIETRTKNKKMVKVIFDKDNRLGHRSEGVHVPSFANLPDA